MAIDVTIRVDQLKADSLWREIRDRSNEAAQDIANDMAERQQELIDSGSRPGGGAQKPNSAGWRRQKEREGRGGQPLKYTGTLSNAAAYRVQTRQQGHGLRASVLNPPAGYAEILTKLRAQGYVTLFDGISEAEMQSAQKAVERQVSKVSVQRHIRRG